MVNYLHDAHMHLDLYNNGMSKVVKQIEKFESYTIAVTNLPPLYHKLNRSITSEYIKVALGFHPELLTKYSKYIPYMWRYLEKARYIGEVGLDLKDKSEIDCRNQVSFFEELLYRCNSIGGKLLTIHSRGSENEVLSLLGDRFNGDVILHWYTGSYRLLNIAIRKNCYFSVNHAMLKTAKGKEIIRRIPVDKILIESDAPFIDIYRLEYSPNAFEYIIAELASIKNVEITQMKYILSKHLELFKI